MGLINAYKIEIWEQGAEDPLYTIEKGCMFVRAKEVLTGNVGTFNFGLLAKKLGSKYFYGDIEPYDTVKIWFAKQAVSGDPFTVGKICRISGLFSGTSGFTRVFFGRNQGEILQRRLKSMKTWEGVAASVLVTELANDLGLGTSEIEEDDTPIDLTIEVDRYETYFDVLRKVSDYWYDAATQVKKDFYVDVNGNLVWKSRPFRTEDVETLTVGSKILTYEVLRDILPVENKIYQYGAAEKKYPSDGDTWTETLDINGQAPNDWEPGGGTMSVSLESSTKIVGSYSIELSVDSTDYYGRLILNVPSGYHPNLNLYPSVHFQILRESTYGNRANLILEDNAGKLANHEFSIAQPSQWILIKLGAGRHHEDEWNWVDDDFNWEDIKSLMWDVYFSGTGTGKFWVDELFFNSRNFYGLAEDAPSQAYGLREATFIDKTLLSDLECAKRAETLLYQMKDIPVRIDLGLKFNTNVRIGDRLPLTIPAENLDAQNFDVISVEQSLTPSEGFRTNAVLLGSANLRTLPPRTKDEVLLEQFRTAKEIAKGIQMVK